MVPTATCFANHTILLRQEEKEELHIPKTNKYFKEFLLLV